MTRDQATLTNTEMDTMAGFTRAVEAFAYATHNGAHTPSTEQMQAAMRSLRPHIGTASTAEMPAVKTEPELHSDRYAIERRLAYFEGRQLGYLSKIPERRDESENSDEVGDASNSGEKADSLTADVDDDAEMITGGADEWIH